MNIAARYKAAQKNERLKLVTESPILPFEGYRNVGQKKLPIRFLDFNVTGITSKFFTTGTQDTEPSSRRYMFC